MRYVDRSQTPIPQTLLSNETRRAIAAIEAHLQLPEKRRLQRRAPYQPEIVGAADVRADLVSLFNGKCAYCERAGDLGMVNHLRPRQTAQGAAIDSDAHYAWLSYDWENLYPCCDQCNKYKANHFPTVGRRAPRFATISEARKVEAALILDPCFDDPRKHISLHPSGEYTPRSKKGRTTIEILGLNRSELMEERRDHISQMERQLESGRLDVDSFLSPGMPFSGATIQYLSAVTEKVVGKRPRWPKTGPDSSSIKYLVKTIDAGRFTEAIGRLATESPGFPLEQAARYLKASAPMLNRELTKSGSIRTIEITNFKGIESLRLTVPPYHKETGRAGCLMLLGENASGKSSVLEAIALALIGTETAVKLISPESLLRRKGGSRFQLVDAEPVRVALDFYDRSDSVNLSIDPLARQFDGQAEPALVVIAYGSRRYSVPGVAWKGTAIERVRALFRPAVPIADSSRWLQTLAERDLSQFYAVARALRQVLALREEDDLVADEELGICVLINGVRLPLDRMSEGYRSLFAMTVDIMREFLRHSLDLESARGVVLIDEVETHLHPRWKLRVMAALRSAMPDVTFVATTHDPLCLRGLDDGEVVVLHKDNRQYISKVEDLPSIKGMRAEQLLTSDYFGLNSTADPEVDLKLATYIEQLALARRTGSATAAKEAHSLERDLADSLVLGDGPADQMVQEALSKYLAERRHLPAPERSEARRQVIAHMLQTLRRPLDL